MNQNKQFSFYIYGKYSVKIPTKITWNNLELNSYLTTQDIFLYREKALNILLTSTNLSPVYVFSSNETYSLVYKNLIGLEEKQNHHNNNYKFSLLVTNPFDQIGNKALSITKVELFQNFLYKTKGTTNNNLVQVSNIPKIPPSENLFYTFSTSKDLNSTTIDFTWNPLNPNLFAQQYLLTFDDFGISRTTTMTICIGSHCRYAPKSIDIDVQNNCLIDNNLSQVSSIFYYDCKRGAEIKLINTVNIDQNSAIIKLGTFTMEYIYDSINKVYSFSLPDTASSSCVPLLIFNTCSYDYNAGVKNFNCQMGNLVQHFFSFKISKDVEIYKISPSLLNLQKKRYHLQIIGDSLSMDFRCFLKRKSTTPNIIELEYLQSNDKLAGCILDITDGNLSTFVQDKYLNINYCIYLEFNYYSKNSSVAFSTSNPNCITKQTQCLDIYFNDFKNIFSIKYEYFSAFSDILNGSNILTGHKYGGYKLKISLSNIQFDLNGSNIYSSNFISPKDIAIKFGSLHIFYLDSNLNNFSYLVNFNNDSPTKCSFYFIIPPIFPDLSLNKNILLNFGLMISPNNGADYLETIFTQKYDINLYSAGKYLAENIPKDCPKGSYCIATQFFPVHPIYCNHGYYQDEIGKTECKNCKASFMCPLEGMVIQEPCYPGMICDKDFTVFPILKCPGGFYCNGGTKDFYYNKNFLLDENFLCPKGYYCEEGTATYNPYVYVNKFFGNLDDEFFKKSYTSVLLKNELLVFNYKETFYSNAEYIKAWLNAFSPIQCFKSYDCNSKGTRIWGKGKCPSKYFCPITNIDKEQVLNWIQKTNPSYDCDNYKCECPEGERLKLNLQIIKRKKSIINNKF